MKKVIIFLFAAYVLSLSYFAFNKIIFKTEIENWQAYKEVIYNYSSNTSKRFHCIRPKLNDDYLVIGISKNRNCTDNDYKAIENWAKQLSFVIDPYVIDRCAEPSSCNIYFSFKDTITAGFNKERTAIITSNQYYNGSDCWRNWKVFNYSYNPYLSYPRVKPYTTLVEISALTSNQELRNFIIKQSFINYLGIYKNHAEIDNYFDVLLNPRIVYRNNNEFRKITEVFDSEYDSHFEWQNQLKLLKKERAIKISESEIKSKTKVDYSKVYPGLGLFTTKEKLTSLDTYILKTNFQKKIGQYSETKISSKYPENVEHINKIIWNASFFIMLLILLFLYGAGYFETLSSLILSQKTKYTILFSNVRDVIPILLFVVFRLISFSVNDTFSYMPIKGSIVFLIEIMFALNIVYLVEKYLFTKPGQFYKQQLIAFFILPFGILTISCVFHFIHIGNKHVIIDMVMVALSFILAVLRYFYNSVNYQKKLQAEGRNEEITRLRELKTRAELNAIQSRINPHFLYNSLNSIAGLAHENPDKVEQMALALSKLYRYCTNKDDSDFESVKNEVEMALVYLEIEKVRFGNRLEYSVVVPKEAEEFMIPKFLIQPLVENAIKHGISNNPGNGTVKLVIEKTINEIAISVFDNGPAFPEDFITGYGLKSIYDKLDILYPEKYSVHFQNKPEKNIRITLILTRIKS